MVVRSSQSRRSNELFTPNQIARRQGRSGESHHVVPDGPGAVGVFGVSGRFAHVFDVRVGKLGDARIRLITTGVEGRDGTVPGRSIPLKRRPRTNKI